MFCLFVLNPQAESWPNTTSLPINSSSFPIRLPTPADTTLRSKAFNPLRNMRTDVEEEFNKLSNKKLSLMESLEQVNSNIVDMKQLGERKRRLNEQLKEQIRRLDEQLKEQRRLDEQMDQASTVICPSHTTLR
ncbi:kinetochore protein NDC80 homolog isoform X1 [Clupea harengus]|uniref:Kinetochore protein NDC80 homolog isoform X1 n=1 Tax=Clupea harengus TaxID=7950 RepID=A0A8M1KMS9_CLUHA|nr:kinetochore protein NDC80 homolog isoform X1 [Clupea harengus]